MARKSNIGTIYAELAVKDKMTAGLTRAEKAVKKFGKQAMVAGGAALGALATGLAIGSKRALAMGGEMVDMSAKTGLAIDSLMILQQAYKDNGKDAESLGKDMAKMKKSIYEAFTSKGGNNDLFRSIGLSAGKLITMAPEQQFAAIGQAIMSIQNPTKQAAVAMEIFGKSGADMLTVFKGTDIAGIKKTLGDMPQIMQQYAAAFDAADDILGRLPNKADQFFTGFTAGVIGEILPQLERIDGFDFSEMGSKLGRAIGIGMEGLTSGELFDVAALKATAKITELGAILVGTMEAAFKTIGDIASGKQKSGITSWIGQTMSGIQMTLEDAAISLSGNEEYKRKVMQQREELFAASREMEANGPTAYESFIKNIEKAGERDGGMVSDANAAADAIMERITKRYDTKRQEAGDLSYSGALGVPFLADLEGIVNGAAMMPQEVAAAAKDTWETTKLDVNEMQARGLSMGGEDIPKAVNKQVDLLEQIRDEIKKQKEQPGSIF